MPDSLCRILQIRIDERSEAIIMLWLTEQRLKGYRCELLFSELAHRRIRRSIFYVDEQEKGKKLGSGIASSLRSCRRTSEAVRTCSSKVGDS